MYRKPLWEQVEHPKNKEKAKKRYEELQKLKEKETKKEDLENGKTN